MEKIWRVKEHDKEAEKQLAKAAGITPLVAGLLRQRGITEPESARRFLSPETKQAYYDPFLLQDMEKAVTRIEKALAGHERIIVYGDYDVDGITSTALLFRALQRLGADVGYYIPIRQEGYGLHSDILTRFADSGVSLVVSVDCGISAISEAAALAGKLDLVITDHHLPGDVLPDAVAVVNPHRAGEAYPYRELAGVGVAFKLCQALWKKMHGKEFTDDLELVAMGTVADMVPLLDENRKLVKEGLKRFKTTSILGLEELIRVSGLREQTVTAGNIGFVLAPRLNAAGRMENAAKGVELLLAKEREKAAALAEELNTANLERKAVEQDILAQAEAQLSNIDTEKARVLVVAGKGWHPGVIGLVASRLTEKYYRPSVVINLADGKGKGSCRSIPGYHLFDALTSCRDTLLQFGGHAMAAGLSVAADKIKALRDGLDSFAAEHLAPEDYQPVLEASEELDPSALTLEILDEIALLEPFGMGNPRPLFLSREIRADNYRLMGREQNHLGFEVGGVRAVGWRMGEDVALVQGGSFDMAYAAEINEWRGTRYPQCRILALREAASRRIFPDRNMLAAIYRSLRDMDKNGSLAVSTHRQIAGQSGVSEYTLTCALRIFTELGLVRRTAEGWLLPPPPRQKLSLDASETFARSVKKSEA